MTLQKGAPPRIGLFLAGLLAVLLMANVPKTPSVTAKEPESTNSGNPIADIEAYVNDELPQTGLPERIMKIHDRHYRLQMTITPAQSQKGLMYVTHLPKNQGMLFRFDPPRAVSFWMKNTKIPLDMLFLSQGRIVNIAQNVPPCQADPCPNYPAGHPVDKVVELPAGTVHQNGITIGDPVQFKMPASRKHAP